MAQNHYTATDQAIFAFDTVNDLGKYAHTESEREGVREWGGEKERDGERVREKDIKTDR